MQIYICVYIYIYIYMMLEWNFYRCEKSRNIKNKSVLLRWGCWCSNNNNNENLPSKVLARVACCSPSPFPSSYSSLYTSHTYFSSYFLLPLPNLSILSYSYPDLYTNSCAILFFSLSLAFLRSRTVLTQIHITSCFECPIHLLERTLDAERGKPNVFNCPKLWTVRFHEGNNHCYCFTRIFFRCRRRLCNRLEEHRFLYYFCYCIENTSANKTLPNLTDLKNKTKTKNLKNKQNQNTKNNKHYNDIERKVIFGKWILSQTPIFYLSKFKHRYFFFFLEWNSLSFDRRNTSIFWY